MNNFRFFAAYFPCTLCGSPHQPMILPRDHTEFVGEKEIQNMNDQNKNQQNSNQNQNKNQNKNQQNNQSQNQNQQNQNNSQNQQN